MVEERCQFYIEPIMRKGGIFIVLFMDQSKYLKLINDSTESYYKVALSSTQASLARFRGIIAQKQKSLLRCLWMQVARCIYEYVGSVGRITLCKNNNNWKYSLELAGRRRRRQLKIF